MILQYAGFSLELIHLHHHESCCGAPPAAPEGEGCTLLVEAVIKSELFAAAAPLLSAVQDELESHLLPFLNGRLPSDQYEFTLSVETYGEPVVDTTAIGFLVETQGQANLEVQFAYSLLQRLNLTGVVELDDLNLGNYDIPLISLWNLDSDRLSLRIALDCYTLTGINNDPGNDVEATIEFEFDFESSTFDESGFLAKLKETLELEVANFIPQQFIDTFNCDVSSSLINLGSNEWTLSTTVTATGIGAVGLKQLKHKFDDASFRASLAAELETTLETVSTSSRTHISTYG